MKNIHYTLLLSLLVFTGTVNTTEASTDDSILRFAPVTAYAGMQKYADNFSSSTKFIQTKEIQRHKSISDLTTTKREFYKTEGIFLQNKKGLLHYESVATSTSEKSDRVNTFMINVISVNDTTYVKFPENGNPLLQKWVIVPNSELKEFYTNLNFEDLIHQGIRDTVSPQQQVIKKVMKASYKVKLFVPIVAINDGQKVENATRQDFMYNPNAIPLFYDELSRTLTEEELKLTPLSHDGFKKALADKKFVSFISEHSHISVWVDNVTHAPVRVYEVFIFKDPNDKKAVYSAQTDTRWEKTDTKNMIHVPTPTMTLEEFNKNFGIKSMYDYYQEIEPINDLKKKLENATSNDEKSDLTYMLAELAENSNLYTDASLYYKKSSEYEVKNSAAYYTKLALAELALNNGKKAKEYFERGLKADPEDFLTQMYFGAFLNGITTASAPYQDLDRALELNEGWEDLHVDDNLTALYVNYILLKQNGDARDLIREFEDFKSPENYITIARAYYRMGNDKKVKEYIDLATKAGYQKNERDDVYFSTSF